MASQAVMRSGKNFWCERNLIERDLSVWPIKRKVKVKSLKKYFHSNIELDEPKTGSNKNAGPVKK